MASQTGGLIHWLASGVVTTAGVAVASGKVRFYATGALTPQTVYSDVAMGTPITQPLTLSAGGNAIVYTNAPIRMIVKDATDTTTLYDTTVNVVPAEQLEYTSNSINAGDQFQLSSMIDGWATSAGQHGAQNAFFTYAYGGSATERNLKDWMGEVHVSVKDFGAIGNGVANDTSGIQSAITAIGAAGGGVVYFPPGTYLINTALTVTNNGIALQGAGILSTSIKQSGGASNTVSVTSVNGFLIADINIQHSSSSTGKAILLTNCAEATIARVVTVSHAVGVGVAAATAGVDIFSSYLGATTTGLQMAGTSNLVNVWGGSVQGAGPCVDFGGSGGNCSLIGVSFNGGGFATGVNVSAGTRYTVINCPSLSSYTTPFASAADPILYQVGNGIDGYTQNVAIGGSHTPTLLKGNVIRIVASSGGAGTVTVNAPTPAPANGQRGQRITVKYVNASGGAVTWAFAAGTFVHVGAAVPANTDLHTISVDYLWDPEASRWREVTRGDTLT